jgi:magnesium transporter
VLSIFRESVGLVDIGVSEDLPRDVVWIDLLNPTAEESALVASQKNVRVPSLDSLREIESSSRLAVDHEVVYLSVPAVVRGDTQDAHLSPTGYILAESVLVTVRFAALSIFDAVVEQVTKDKERRSPVAVFVALLEATVDRGADVLEHLGAELDKVSKSVFRGDPSRARHTVRSNDALRRALTAVGTTGDRLALARDALLEVSRVAPFVLSLRRSWITSEMQSKLEAVQKDVVLLNDYESQLSNKVQFLLDLILGFISIQQNNLFKMLTIASVVGIPPMLVAGIYGMNFKVHARAQLGWGLSFRTDDDRAERVDPACLV